jgi:archaellum component FlaD/FlaE
MDLGDVMRELGLDDFGSSSASSASSQGRDPAPNDAGDFDELEGFEEVDEAETTTEETDPFEDEVAMPTEEDDAEFATAEADSGTETGGTGIQDDRTDEILEQLDDISYEIDQLSTDVEENQSTIRTLRNEREGLRERMDSIEENNATMLGIYDRLTNEINPFAADWDERYDQKVSEQDGPEYGVIEPPENEMEVRREIMEQREDETADEESPTPTPEPEEEGAVSFDDLKHKHDGDDGSESVESANEPVTEHSESNEAESAVHDGASPDDPSRDDATERANVDEPPIDPAAPAAAVEAAPGKTDGPYLSALAPTVATEVLIMDWLSLLIDIAGPAGAMKALDFYERVGWISTDIKRQLEDVLSGAHERGDQPSRPPSDLTADEHNRSFAHIVRLAQQAQLARSREG